MSKLNLFSTRCNISRSTAGTADKPPGQNDTFLGTLEVAKRTQKIDEDLPELLPVSCGYFNALVNQLLLKQRKMILKYVLLDTNGRTFDRLLKYIRYHSLSDLLVELMQVNLMFQLQKPAAAEGEKSVKEEEKSSLADDDERKNGDSEAGTAASS